jgi:hypothetical protein
MLLADGYTRVINFATALTNDTLEVWPRILHQGHPELK